MAGRPSRSAAGWPRIAERRSIHDRPDHIATRHDAGHWEADAMLFSTAVRQTSLRADPVAAALTRMLRRMPPQLRQSITFDNGTEFAQHRRIARQLGVQTFCDPRAPWQKGGIEHAIGRLRRLLPRKTNLNALSRTNSMPSSAPTTIPHENASAS